jgi:hypothetical protein
MYVIFLTFGINKSNGFQQWCGTFGINKSKGFQQWCGTFGINKSNGFQQWCGTFGTDVSLDLIVQRLGLALSIGIGIFS